MHLGKGSSNVSSPEIDPFTGQLVFYQKCCINTSTLLGSLIPSGESMTVQVGSNIQITNYLDLQGDLIVEGIFGVQ
jgi:nucleoid-associated protein YejK